MAINKKAFHDEMTGRGSFGLVPNELLYVNIDSEAKWLWIYLLMQSPKWESSRNNLAKNLKHSKDTISRYLKQLEELNLIVTSIGAQNNYDIEILPPSNWKNIVPPSQNDQKVEAPNNHREKLTSRTSLKSGPQASPDLPEVHISRRDREREETNSSKASAESIYQRWLAEVSEIPKFTNCYQELLLLLGSIRDNGHQEEAISSGLRKKIMARWSGSKYPARHEDAWNRAVGTVFASSVQLSMPNELVPSNAFASTKIDSQISPQKAAEMTTDDDEVAALLAEFERIKGASEL